MNFSTATEVDCEQLTQTAIIAKKHWGYSDELLEQWYDDLAITPKSFDDRMIVKAEVDGTFVGFYVLLRELGFATLDGLWILPAFHGKGLGKTMVHHALEQAKLLGYPYVELYADPHVDGFYQRLGGQVVGQQETVIKDRYLSIFHFKL